MRVESNRIRRRITLRTTFDYFNIPPSIQNLRRKPFTKEKKRKKVEHYNHCEIRTRPREEKVYK